MPTKADILVDNILNWMIGGEFWQSDSNVYKYVLVV